MKPSFLDRISLGTLIAPETEATFVARHWEKRPLIVHRKDPNHYGDLFTLEDFDHVIASIPEAVHTANATKKKTASHKSGSVAGLEAVFSDMRDGATLLLDTVNTREPKLGLLCRLLQSELGHRFWTNLYLTPAHGKGFTPHWDNHDVFILQVMGSKRWKIEKLRRAFPDKTQTVADDERELRGELHDFTLEQGDIVYIPRGFVHAAECGDEPSLHITLGMMAFFLEDLLHAAIRAAVKRNERLRAALPLGFMKGDIQPLVARTMAALQETADEAFLSAVVDEYRDEMVKRFPLDVAGQVVDFFRPIALSTDDETERLINF